MFNKDYHFHVNPNIHIKHEEHRAPTDESVRLLKELEEKATQKLLSITRLENNHFKAMWHTFEQPGNFEYKTICQFELNGANHQFDVIMPASINPWPDIMKDIEMKVRKTIVEKLTSLIVADFVDKVLIEKTRRL